MADYHHSALPPEVTHCGNMNAPKRVTLSAIQRPLFLLAYDLALLHVDSWQEQVSFKDMTHDNSRARAAFKYFLSIRISLPTILCVKAHGTHNNATRFAKTQSKPIQSTHRSAAQRQSTSTSPPPPSPPSSLYYSFLIQHRHASSLPDLFCLITEIRSHQNSP